MRFFDRFWKKQTPKEAPYPKEPRYTIKEFEYLDTLIWVTMPDGTPKSFPRRFYARPIPAWYSSPIDVQISEFMTTNTAVLNVKFDDVHIMLPMSALRGVDVGSGGVAKFKVCGYMPVGPEMTDEEVAQFEAEQNATK